ncbi:SET domain-containing protein [Mycena chlorophos]|uniref:SET domain-containing protein n=1 Tax=Mycena chlorophos TaxID=658473 RepID=A0A8H6VXZ8_MYCCL|nr:SET domain-containing protein [Mycena chlorophos]
MKRGFLNSTKSKARMGAVSDAIQAKPGALPAKPNTLPAKPAIVPASFGLGFDLNNTETVVLPQNAGPDEQVTVCYVWRGSKEIIVQKPGFPTPVCNVPNPPFRIGSTSGKGQGLFATRRIAQGEPILAERPFLIAIRAPLGSMLPEMERRMEDVLKRMRPADRDAFMALHNGHTHDGSGEIIGRVRTNALSLSGLVPEHLTSTVMGLYCCVARNISLLNNDCSPNTASNWRDESLSYHVFAAREIQEGEELTLCYADPFDRAAQRQATFKPYGFVCRCAACLDPTASDRRRAAIRGINIMELFSQWVMDKTLPGDWIVDKCLERLKLIEQEGLQCEDDYQATLMMLIHACICRGDAKKASEWVARILRCAWKMEQELEPLLDAGSSAYKNHSLWRKRL